MELYKIVTDEKRIIVSNAITSGSYDYSACMMDILFMILSILKKEKDTYTISAKEIETITGREWNYAQLTQSTELLGSRVFEIETPDTFDQIWLFSSVRYLKGKGTFEVTLNEKAKYLFFELKNNFTSLQLKSTLTCSSKYAKRIYGLACQWQYKGEKTYEIRDLKKILGLIDRSGNEKLIKISDFQKRVLDIAKEQINAKTDMRMDYELHKEGRSFKWVTFKFSSREVEIQKFNSVLMKYGLSEIQSAIVSSKMDYEEFSKIVREILSKVSRGELSLIDSTEYLVKILRDRDILPKL